MMILLCIDLFRNIGKEYSKFYDKDTYVLAITYEKIRFL